jgi:hypothetical protein
VDRLRQFALIEPGTSELKMKQLLVAAAVGGLSVSGALPEADLPIGGASAETPAGANSTDNHMLQSK